MNREESIRLIEAFKLFPVLWDPKNKNYHNRGMREDAWKEISGVMEHPVQAVKNRMKTLMGSYRSEKSRENKTKITGSSSDAVYRSKWFGFEYFDFLKNKDNPNKTLDTAGKNESEAENVDEACAEPVPAGSSASDTVLREQNVVPQKKQRRGSKTDNDCDKLMGEALRILKSSASASSDPHFAYAWNLPNELKKYDARTLSVAKKLIADIIYKADMGRLDENSIIVSPANDEGCNSSPAARNASNCEHTIFLHGQSLPQDNAEDLEDMLCTIEYLDEANDS